MEQCFNFNAWPNEFTLRPVNIGVKGAEPWVTKDKSISSKVRDVKSFRNFLISSGHEEVEVVGDASGFVISAVNVS